MYYKFLDVIYINNTYIFITPLKRSSVEYYLLGSIGYKSYEIHKIVPENITIV